MSWARDTPFHLARVAERHPWLFAIGSIVFWTLLWPLALLWLALWLVAHYRNLNKGIDARQHRRVQRLLRWYPSDWRARYGDEMAALLHDTIAEGRDGLRLSINVAKEGVAMRVAPPERRHAAALVCLSLCSIPLFPQGIVAAVMKLTHTPTRSWFLALYLPDSVQWPAIAAMITLGLLMLYTGTTLARRPVRSFA